MESPFAADDDDVSEMKLVCKRDPLRRSSLSTCASLSWSSCQSLVDLGDERSEEGGEDAEGLSFAGCDRSVVAPRSPSDLSTENETQLCFSVAGLSAQEAVEADEAPPRRLRGGGGVLKAVTNGTGRLRRIPKSRDFRDLCGDLEAEGECA